MPSVWVPKGRAPSRSGDLSSGSALLLAPTGPTAPAPVPVWSPPAEFDDYRIVQRLGHGAMGEVFLAHDRVLDRRVAIKFVGHIDPRARERFLVEARATARIQHPNVMAMFRIGELDGHPYLVSEYVRGKSLAELSLPIPWLHALQLAVGLARGLAAAHRQGVLHRDIKPANVLLDADGVVKLLDFSLAKLVAGTSSVITSPGLPDPTEDGNPEMTVAGTLLGTPTYMAPELWRGVPASPSSDVYALGVLLYSLCLGRPPTEAASPYELGELVQLQEPPPLAERVPDIDRQFAAIVDRCLRRRPDERFASGEELRAALEALVPVAHAAAARIGNPYRGLRAFEAEHCALFFGRTREVQAVVARLRTHAFVVVAGDSGVGKSSLCRAGVLPAIRAGALDRARTWTAVALTPGRYPSRALAAALAGALERTPADVARALDEDPAQLIRDVSRDLGEDRGVVLLIDQLEELITLAGPLEAAVASQMLTQLVADIPGICVLATTRGDFLTRLARLPGLHNELPLALYFLLPLSSEGIREAIVGPAQARGVRFESAQFVDHLVTAGVEGSLPLLQFALAELWEARDVGSATITNAALARIGGVSAALARHADSVLARLTADQRRAARIILMRLVTVDGTRASLTTHELLAGLESPAALEALLAARLLVTREVPDGTVHEIAHEALIRGWLTLQVWLDEDREARVVRHRLEADAAEWDRLARPRVALWHEHQLAESAQVDPSTLRPRELDFLTASRAHVGRRRTTRRLAALAALAVVLVTGLVVHRAHGAIVARSVDAHHDAAALALVAARDRVADAAAHRDAALAAFTADDPAAGRAAWQLALAAAPAAAVLLDDAARELEAAIYLDPTRADLRGEFAAVLRDRAALAEQTNALTTAVARAAADACAAAPTPAPDELAARRATVVGACEPAEPPEGTIADPDLPPACRRSAAEL